MTLATRETADGELARLRAELASVREELNQTRRTLEDAQRLAHLGSWEWDLVTNVVTRSEQYQRMLGMGLEGPGTDGARPGWPDVAPVLAGLGLIALRRRRPRNVR